MHANLFVPEICVYTNTSERTLVFFYRMEMDKLAK